MEYVVVKVNANWADEIDLEGIMVMSEGAWDKWYTTLEKYFERGGVMNLPVGSNQSIEIEDFDDWRGCVYAHTRLTEAEKDVVVRALGGDSIGFVDPLYTDWLDSDILEEIGYWD